MPAGRPKANVPKDFNASARLTRDQWTALNTIRESLGLRSNSHTIAALICAASEEMTGKPLPLDPA